MVLINVCWHSMLIWVISSLDKLFSAVSVASSKSSSRLLLSPTVWATV